MSVDLIRKAGSTGSKLVRRWRWNAAMNRDPGAPGFSDSTAPVPEPRLVMSELLVLGGLALATVWSRLSAVVPLERTFIVNHLPGLVTVVGLILTFIGAGMRTRDHANRVPILRPGRIVWPLLVLAVFAFGGSSYAQIVEKTSNTFRNLGMYMLAVYFVSWTTLLSRAPIRLVTIYFSFLVVSGVLATVAMITVFFTSDRSAAPFHEIEFLIIPLVVYIATRRREMSMPEAIIVWLGIGMAVFFQKNTGYIVALGTVLYLWVMHWRVSFPRAIAIRRALQFLIVIVVVLLLGAAYIKARSAFNEFVPTGNTDFRMQKYEMAWHHFLDSPVWGTAFSKPASELFTLYDTGVAGNVLPTHSDLLDILANGGIVGITLFLSGHYMILMAVNRNILARRDYFSPHLVAMTHALTCMMLLGVVTYSFNPLLLNPVRALLIWSQTGLLVGLACICAQNQETSSKGRSET